MGCGETGDAAARRQSWGSFIAPMERLGNGGYASASGLVSSLELRDELDPSTVTTLDITSLAAMLTGFVNANTTDVRLDGTVTRAADFVPPTGIYQYLGPLTQAFTMTFDMTHPFDTVRPATIAASGGALTDASTDDEVKAFIVAGLSATYGSNFTGTAEAAQLTYADFDRYRLRNTRFELTYPIFTGDIRANSAPIE